jgi:hypothetical protein
LSLQSYAPKVVLSSVFASFARLLYCFCVKCSCCVYQFIYICYVRLRSLLKALQISRLFQPSAFISLVFSFSFGNRCLLDVYSCLLYATLFEDFPLSYP